MLKIGLKFMAWFLASTLLGAAPRPMVEKPRFRKTQTTHRKEKGMCICAHTHTNTHRERDKENIVAKLALSSALSGTLPWPFISFHDISQHGDYKKDR